MKRGLILFGIILLVAPMASAGFFNDFFENLMDRSGSSITGYATVPALSSLLKSTSTTTVKTTIPSTATLDTTATSTAKTTTSNLPSTTKTTATTPVATKSLKISSTTATKTAATTTATVPKLALVKPSVAVKKIVLKNGLFQLDKWKVSIINAETGSAKAELALAGEETVDINGQSYKITKIEREGKTIIKFTPVTAAADSSATDASKDAAAKGTASSVLPKPATSFTNPLATTKTAATTSKTAAKTTTPTTTVAKTTTTTATKSLSGLLGGLSK